MIRIEYDVPTSGVRVSFVLSDAQSTSLPEDSNLETLFVKGGVWAEEVPQNQENIKTLIAMLECLLDKS